MGAATDPLVSVSLPAAVRVDDLVLSRLIGSAAGERRFLRSLCAAAAGICWVDGGRLRGDRTPVSGWPDSRSLLRSGGIEPTVIDRIWQQSVAEDGDLALLPGSLLDALVSARSRPLIREVVQMGPIRAQERLERFCRLETLRQTRFYAGRVSTVSAGTIDALLSSARRLFVALHWFASRGIGDESLSGWALLPPPASAEALGATPAHLDRTAPPLQLVQETLARLDDQLSVGSSHQRRRTLRHRALLGLLACTGARIGALGRVRVSHIDDQHRFPDATIGPALLLHPGKTRAASQGRWKALPLELHWWVSAHVDALALHPEQPLFPQGNDPTSSLPRAPESLTRILSGSRRAPGLLPRSGGPGGYSAHTLRHLAAQLAHRTGRRHIASEAQPVAPTPEAFVACLLDHSHARDPLGYLDTTTEANRELTARAATHGIWTILRNPDTDDATEHQLEQLRRKRRQLLSEPQPDAANMLETLVTAAALTATIDDLSQHS